MGKNAIVICMDGHGVCDVLDAIIATGESTLYANVMIQKGVVV